jgi:hypothetical protein
MALSFFIKFFLMGIATLVANMPHDAFFHDGPQHAALFAVGALCSFPVLVALDLTISAMTNYVCLRFLLYVFHQNGHSSQLSGILVAPGS